MTPPVYPTQRSATIDFGDPMFFPSRNNSTSSVVETRRLDTTTKGSTSHKASLEGSGSDELVEGSGKEDLGATGSREPTNPRFTVLENEIMGLLGRHGLPRRVMLREPKGSKDVLCATPTERPLPPMPPMETNHSPRSSSSTIGGTNLCRSETTRGGDQRHSGCDPFQRHV
ncbi:hypothetical protein CC1G_08417 [Coprinopsis cinerea okayama7|uniref:Uncharacterized protein n=1 Tax=Coprinopsis cinerea (strain Okayama-7 / 130 / ATCC MYA-4618 / FGSC 9003) TaxID=240176 RepID=A8NAP8_COPC7|nr:hypothetical protein CC1G_08417 [Coprinopsis cinerea okayama7\|eukprot:XP_001831900.1 hypothetical protein CC1G_08417 [Coprinopsis cinerea okayama7\